MRWTLGEQSAKQLRGGRMDDVIFAGNQRRRPVGMSEVTLSFDNSDGVLPTPFAEIAVTRRVYRNGEGEYFLNKSQVRLRDIMDLLLGTGLGPDASAIISQGEIDSILSAKPLARREVFEEVAGTSKYQARKQEAQRRLEQTESNALRVNDVLVELERQVPAIEQQVRRAKRYQKVVGRLRDLEILSFLLKTEARRGERAQLARTLGEEELERTAVERRRTQLETDASRARYDEYQATLALDERNAARSDAADAVQEAASAHATAQARLEEQGRRCEALELELDGAARAITAAEAEVASLVAQLAQSRERRDAAMRDVEQRSGAERTGTAAWERAYASLRDVEDRRAKAAARAAEAEAAAQALSAMRERAQTAVREIETEDAKTVEALAAHEQRVAELKDSLADAHRALAAVTEDVALAHRAHTVAAQALEEVRADLETKRTAVAHAQARHDALREFESSGQGRPSAVQAVLDAKAAGRGAGVIGAVSDLLDVDRQYAAAIDVALGPQAHALVTSSSEGAHAAIKLLRQARAGRATFVPLDAVRQRELPLLQDARSKPGVVGLAADLVRCSDDVRPAIEYLLGNVIVVDKLATALTLGRKYAHASVVTVGGELVRDVAITGGSGEADAGPVTRRVALEDLAKSLAAHQDAANKAQEGVTAARRVLDEATAHGEATAQRRADGLTQRQDTAVKLERVQTETEALGGARAGLEEQLGSARVTLEKADAQWRAADERAASSRAAVAALEEERAKAAAESDALQKGLTTMRDQHRKAAADAAALVERVAQVGDDVEAARATIIKRRDEHTASVAGLAQAKHEQAAADEQATAAQGRRAEAEAALTAIQTEADALRGKRDELVGTARALEEQLSGEQQQTQARRLEFERHKLRMAEIDAELGLLQETFAQNPATPEECDEVSKRCAGYADDADSDMRRLRDELARLGGVNLNALEDQAALVERRDFLRRQLQDLEDARKSILSVIAEIDAESVRQFNAVFEKVAEAFGEMFARLFSGGVGRIWLAQSDDPALAGVEIAAQPPGKKMQSLNALSGGERSLTAVALVFAILKVRPSPFYILDEIDAALDEANIGRFGAVLAEFASRAQIIIITHNKATMTLADRIYGVTMGEPGVSSLLSLALEQVGA